MSVYALNKMLREINRNPEVRQRYTTDPRSLAHEFQLTEEESRAFLENDIGVLYRLGVHGLILRPFTILQQMPEADYLRMIRS